MDSLYQGYHHTLLYPQGIRCSTNVGNPYHKNPTQMAFCTFGNAHALALLPEICSRAMKAAFNYKWTVSRRGRPEAFGGRVHLTKTGVVNDSISSELLKSDVLNEVFNKWGSYLLPQAYPEGSPTYPSVSLHFYSTIC
jgi:hypothetical protein